MHDECISKCSSSHVAYEYIIYISGRASPHYNVKPVLGYCFGRHTGPKPPRCIPVPIARKLKALGIRIRVVFGSQYPWEKGALCKAPLCCVVQ